MDRKNETDDKNETEKLDRFKICMFSKDEQIIHQFFTALKVQPLFTSSKQENIGIELVVLSYQTSKRFIFQLWSISNKSRFEIMIPTYILRSRGIIYFYHITDKIEENRLKLVKNGTSPKIPILFVGYDSILPKKPELNDENIRLIQKYFGKFNSLYVSMDKPYSVFQILNRIIDLDEVKMTKEMTQNTIKRNHFKVILGWKSKAEKLYGFERVSYEDYAFGVNLNEQYDISFSNNHEVEIEIPHDLNDMAIQLYSKESDRKVWIEDEIKTIISKMNNELNALLTIIKRNQMTRTVLVHFKAWNSKSIPVISIYSKKD
jgi:GTPase SAR1 family protein